MEAYSGNLNRVHRVRIKFLNLVQDSFLTQHVLEGTTGEKVLDIGLNSQKECVDNVKMCETLGCLDPNQIYIFY